MKKKEYISPEFEEIRISLANNILSASTEGAIHDGEREVDDW